MKKETIRVKNWFRDFENVENKILEVIEKVQGISERLTSEENASFILALVNACCGAEDAIKSVKIKGEMDDGTPYQITIKPL